MPTTTPEEHANRQHTDDRRDRDPEVEWLHPAEPPELREVDHPEDDRVDDDRGQDGLGQLGEERREQDQRREDDPSGRERGDRRPGPGGFVQRARRQARRHGHALEEAGADVRHSLGNRLLVEVDPIPMPRRECLGIARGLGEPDQQEREGRDRDRREVLRHDIDRWHLRKRQASRHGANQRDSLRSQVEKNGADQPADDEDERPGILGARTEARG